MTHGLGHSRDHVHQLPTSVWCKEGAARPTLRTALSLRKGRRVRHKRWVGAACGGREA